MGQSANMFARLLPSAFPAGGRPLCWLLIGLGLACLGKVAGQTYAPASVTYADGRTDSVTVRLDAYDRLGREVYMRRGDRIVAVPAAEIERLEGEDFTFAQVSRPYVNNADDVVPARRLARLLVRGEVSLYRLDIQPVEKKLAGLGPGASPYTYFLRRGGEFLELEQHVVSTGNGIRVRNPYQGVLNYYMRDCPDVVGLLAQRPPDYEDRALSKLVLEYNDCSGAEATVVAVAGQRVRLAGVWAQAGVLHVQYPPDLPARLDGPIPFAGLRAELRPGRGGSRRLAGEVGVDVYGRTYTRPLTRDSCYWSTERPGSIDCAPVPDGTYDTKALGLRLPLAVTIDLVDPERSMRPFVTVGATAGCDWSYGLGPAGSLQGRLGVGLRSRRWRLLGVVDTDRTLNASIGHLLFAEAPR